MNHNRTQKTSRVIFGLFISILTILIILYTVKADLNEGLVGHWDFNEGSGSIAYDKTLYGNHGQINGPTWIDEGITGYALEYDGNFDNVIVEDGPCLNFNDTNQFTLSIWVKWNGGISPTRHQGLIQNNFQHKGYDIILWNSGIIKFQIGDGEDYYILNSTTILNLNWHHIVAKWDGYCQYIFIDGVLDNFSIIDSFYIKNSDKNLEFGNNWGQNNHHTFNGFLDEIRIYDRGLNTLEIKQLYEQSELNQLPNSNFSMDRMKKPGLIMFNASTQNSTDLTLKWDFNNDGIFDMVGDYDTASKVLYQYKSPGVYHPNLYVENNFGISNQTNKIGILTNYSTYFTNDNYFISYPFPLSLFINPIQNKYYFTCPQDIFKKVVFRLDSIEYHDNEPIICNNNSIWSAIIDMNEGTCESVIIIEGYDYEDDLVWEHKIESNIIITPDWFSVFLLTSDTFENIEVYNSPNYDYWSMCIKPKYMGLEYNFSNISLDFIGGKYGINATVTGPKQLIVESNIELPKYYSLCSLDMPLWNKSGNEKRPFDIGSYKKAEWYSHINFGMTACINFENSHIDFLGKLQLDGSAGVTFDIPIYCIPFVAEAGLTGGMDLDINTNLDIGKLGPDGLTLCPNDQSKSSLGFKGNAGLYAEALKGLARVEGGLEAEGRLTMMLPSLNKSFLLYGGVYAKASALWGIWSDEWYYGMDLEINEKSNNETSNNKNKISFSTDILCLQNTGEKIIKKTSKNNNLTILSSNVAEISNPRIILTEKNTGIAIWEDISINNNNTIQSDLWWSIYTNDSWNELQNSDTQFTCEYNPQIKLNKKHNGLQEILLAYLSNNKTITNQTNITTFYNHTNINFGIMRENNILKTFNESLSFNNVIINSFDFCIFTNEKNESYIYITCLIDDNPHPFQHGNGSIIFIYGKLSELNILWESPQLIKENLELNTHFDFIPTISYISESVGCICYKRYNTTNELNEIVIQYTTNNERFFEKSLYQTINNISQLTCFEHQNKFVISWIENNSIINEMKFFYNSNSQSPDDWVFLNNESIYTDPSISYIKPFFSNDKCYYLIQKGESFLPCIIEQLKNNSWGNYRTIDFTDTYCNEYLDGDVNSNQSILIYTNCTPVTTWEITHWRFNEGFGNITTCSKNSDNVGEINGLYIQNQNYNKSSIYWVRNNGEINNLSTDYGYHLRFINTSGFVKTPPLDGFNISDQFTISSWIKLSNFTSYSTIIDKEDSFAIVEKNGTIGFLIYNNNDSYQLFNITKVPLNTWFFTNVKYNNELLNMSIQYNSSKFYIEYQIDEDCIKNSNSSLIMGGFNGSIDEVRIFHQFLPEKIIDSILFSPYSNLGGFHNIIVQPFPSYARFQINNKSNNLNSTTEEINEFCGFPENFDFEWGFGDGNKTNGTQVYHSYQQSGYYTVYCNATDPKTNIQTPLQKIIYIIDDSKPIFSGLIHAEEGNNSVRLYWESASDNSNKVYYKVFIREPGTDYNFENPLLITDDTSCVISNLTAYQSYFFIAHAFDDKGNMDNNTNEKCVIPYDLRSPMFDGLQIAKRIISNCNSIYLEWNEAFDVSEISKYSIYISNESGNYDFNQSHYSTNNTWYKIDNLTKEKTYIIVRAEDIWNNEDKNIIEHMIQLNNIAPSADFKILRLNTTNPNEIYFTDTSTDPDGYIVNWSWNLDDVIISSEQNLIHSYVENGFFNVSLTVVDNDGIHNTISKNVNITDNNAPETPNSPLGVIECKIGINYSFQTITIDNEDDAVYYKFDWGDGTISNWIGPYESEILVETDHTWLQIGNYEIATKAKDSWNQESNWSEPLSITVIPNEEHLDINQSIFDRGFPIRHAADGDWAVAQNFTPTVNTISRIDLFMRKFGSPEFNLTAEIRLNHTQGPLLDTISFNPDEVESYWHWLTIDFNDIIITSETNLFIICPPAPVGVTTSFGYEWGYAFGNHYIPGSFWFTRNSGELWRDLPTSYELTFKTYGYE